MEHSLKWFKHPSNLLEEPEMQILLDKHGAAGPLAFILLLEYCARHFDVDNPGHFVMSKRKLYLLVSPFLQTFRAQRKIKYGHFYRI